MPTDDADRRPLRVPRWPAEAAAAPDFAAIRGEFELPEDFPADVLAEAEQAARRPPLPELDATDLPLVTLDPPGSRDLDQAVHLAPRGTGYRVSYAIADVGAFVALGSQMDAQARRRGQTVYCPDRRIPLHPPLLSEGAASLLQGELRPAVLWRIDLDADGEVTSVDVRRARVRSVGQLDYPSVQASVTAGTLPEPLALLPRIGALLQEGAAARGGIELGTPSQEVVADGADRWTLAFRGDLPVEGWNAQISLLTGRCAAALMLDAGVGILRTLPPAPAADVDRLRRLAPALGISWPDGASVGAVLTRLDRADPRAAAFLEEAATLLRGAAYTAFDGPTPQQAGHAGVGAPYAHVTAPLRRLVDRFGSSLCLALCEGQTVDPALRAALPALPGLMAASDRRSREVERAVVAATEAWLLRGREGELFDAVVVDAEDARGTVVLRDLAVRARCEGPGLRAGSVIHARLVTADVAGRLVRFRTEDDR